MCRRSLGVQRCSTRCWASLTESGVLLALVRSLLFLTVRHVEMMMTTTATGVDVGMAEGGVTPSAAPCRALLARGTVMATEGEMEASSGAGGRRRHDVG